MIFNNNNNNNNNCDNNAGTACQMPQIGNGGRNFSGYSPSQAILQFSIFQSEIVDTKTSNNYLVLF